MGTRFSAKTGYLMKQVVQGSARLDSAYGVLCLPWDAHLQIYKAGKCLILYATHTHTYTHSHPHTYIYIKGYICMYVHINIFNSCPYLPI